MYKIQKYAFTLAEVLITLGIIGVVAAMTMPALINQTNNKQHLTAYKKVYSSLSQTLTSIIADNGDSFDGLCQNHNDYLKLFSKYMLKVQECNSNNTTDKCWHSKWYSLNGIAITSNENQFSSLILPDGSIMLFNHLSPDCTSTSELLKPIGCARIRVDTNGNKKPNTVGRDIFDFYITKNRIIPRGSEDTTASTTQPEGWGRGAYLLQEDKMDY